MYKPPDKYRTGKCSLEYIIKDTKTKDKLFDAVVRTHKIIIHSYQFLRLWLLKLYHNKKELPVITVDIIKMVFKTLIKESAGPKPKGKNLEMLNEFKQFYYDEYKKLDCKNKLDGSNLSQILGYMATDMITNIENNIKLNFVSYVKRFVNSSFKKQNNDLLEKCKKGEKTKLRKQLNKDLFEIKNDLLNDTLKTNEKYHDWINKNKVNIFPKSYKDSYEFDIKNNPYNYVKGMIFMCLEIEKVGTKAFQFFPLRNDIAPKYIPIDTKSIIEILVKKDKNTYLKNIEEYKSYLWNQYFNTNQKVFKQKHYTFDYKISTDCQSVSIQLLHNSFLESENDKKHLLRDKRNETKEACKDMTQEEKEKYKNDLKDAQKKKLTEERLKKKLLRDEEKAKFKKLSKEEQQKIREQKEKERIKYVEFPYLEELDEKQIENLKKVNMVYIDPGKRCLLYIKSDDGKRLRYTNRKHMFKTKRLKYQKLIQNYKNKNGISKIENKLSLFNSKSCDYKKFKEFVKKKNEVNDKLFKKYEEKIFRKYKWYGYINRKRSETDLIREIKNTFGNNIILCYGDWSIGKAMRHFISTPNLGLKRKLGEYFTIYSVDEFRTSLLNFQTETKCENIYLPDKKGELRKIHSVLTFKTENQRLGCINRDENSVRNIQKITNYFLKNKDRPEKFKRSFKFPEEIKDGDPLNGVKHHQAE